MHSLHTDGTVETREDKVLALASRALVWSVFASVLFLLRNFFLLVFLTFVFCWIQSYGESWLKPRIKNRSLRVTIVGVIFLAILVAIGFITVPRAKDQAQLFAERFPTYLKKIDSEVIELRNKYPVLVGVLPEPVPGQSFSMEGEEWSPKNSTAAMLLQDLFGMDEAKPGHASKNTLQLLQNVGVKVFATISSFFLALLFSFLIVLDLDRLLESMRRLRNTKIQFVYDEVADGIYDFGQVFGRALGAQVVIAVVNTIFTAALILFLGLGDKLAFLSLVVFLCSFIPVAGVFISSIPICLIVLQESGFQMVLITALAIWIIHLIEAYILNPRIFGKHLRINPVLVLIILTVSGKLFGVWGLILGVPVCSYVFGHAIRYPSQKTEEVASVS